MTGGYDGYYLDSTELYDSSVGSWVIAGAKLPRPMSDLRAVNIDDRVLIFGKFSKMKNSYKEKHYVNEFKKLVLINFTRGWSEQSVLCSFKNYL